MSKSIELSRLGYDTFHPKLPGLGFVGIYKGPYFGPMELQARLMAGLMSGQVILSEDDMASALDNSQFIRRQPEIRKKRAPFPRFDSIGMMDSLAYQLDWFPVKKSLELRE
mmetsp:Transcript_35952/g.53572  ORF Transcript_35952/g.53572 Transcript_35952/m.53572 type:complete len:111 (-) Transcript_35952:52-384(-)